MGLYLTKVLCGKKGISMQLKKKSSISKPLVHKERLCTKQTTKKEKKIKDSLDSLFDISADDSVQVISVAYTWLSRLLRF